MPPGEIAANARRQLKAYPTLTWLEARVEAVTGQVDEFTVRMPDGGSHQGRRMLLATGVTDHLPAAVVGLAERWGKTVFHCPYCHGYEIGQGHIGIVGASPMSIHQAELLTDWGDVTLLVNGAVDLSQDAWFALERRGVAIEEATIDRIEGHADVVMADGRRLSFTGLFTATRTSPSSSPGRSHGLRAGRDAHGHPGSHRCREQDLSDWCVSPVVTWRGHPIRCRLPWVTVPWRRYFHRSLLWPETLVPTQTEGRI